MAVNARSTAEQRALDTLLAYGWNVEARADGYVAERGPRGVWGATLVKLMKRAQTGLAR
jgi:hypothetical protein